MVMAVLERLSPADGDPGTWKIPVDRLEISPQYDAQDAEGSTVTVVSRHIHGEFPGLPASLDAVDPPPFDLTGRRVLVVDDEEYITDLLGTALRFVGADVRVAMSGSEALAQIASFGPELVLLDVMMPPPDGFEVARRLRADGLATPVIFLTARDAASDRVNGFTKGGDDYVTKPFSLEELIARVRAVLRRASGVGTPSRLGHGGIELDDDAHRVWRDGERVDLSPTEFKLLRYLLLNAGRVVSKAQILDHVWQYDFDGDAGVVENYISYLRKKLDTGEDKLIHTIRGVGYSLRSDA
jgi:two-component system, OmpR family, response regulator